jgi:hypothetical protein
MSPTVFAGIPWGDRTHIWMKDITQPGLLDNTLYGVDKKASGPGFVEIGGFAFSKVDPYPPRMYFGQNSSLFSVKYPTNSVETFIKSDYVSNPVHLDVQKEGARDVIYFCTRDGYYK